MRTGYTEASPGKVTRFFVNLNIFEVCHVEFFVSSTDVPSRFLASLGVLGGFCIGIQCHSFVYGSKIDRFLPLDSA